ncbi:hypothetical protein C8Q74DRAFT_1203301 [Fomes fomentarius]|nr:hypothetical protein C8Q74DRAFT_1203301 [Fomes fomentarius]
MPHTVRSVLSTLRPAALRVSPRATSSTPPTRTMLSAATFPVEEPQAPSLHLPILDIFDAPSRLGEAGKLLALHAAASSSRPARPLGTFSRRSAVKPLPAPVVLDGPARPRGMAFVSFRQFRPRPVGASRRDASEAGARARPLPTPLPSPMLFDGPSRLRPYCRGGSSSSAAYAMSATPLMLAIAAAALLFGVDVAPYTSHASQEQRSPDA